ncbi:protoheme IX farnesyltransferase [Caldalkalibacillus uzonensis]|uniref:Protoheme IX farnesyltransferase n=1 Tax=Caldalkalibacillus uzonensis TaxID=353224 RepID=A0ABU0CM78_9BACI|nr:heme o synthase [Caldalkalibacillus uzonensis]MDQ0337523.1 protoheme IX farnesyltransferase [Caldalkalibacillus uzonensis]
MDKAVKSVKKEYISRHVMEPGPLADRKLSGTWKDYVTVTKVGIILGNLLTVLTGMWLAAGGFVGFSQLSLALILLTLLGTALIIASGTCLNNFIDRDIDQKMLRTKNRALAEGRLDPKNVLIMGYILAVLGTVLLLFVNWVATMMALIGLFFYVVVYTMWLKRTHHLNTVVGGVAGAMPPVIGWTAVTGSLDPGAWVFFAFMFVWQPPHFLALAMRRCEDYRAAGIPMLPVVKGFGVTKQQIVLWVAALIPTSLYLYLVTNVGWSYVWLALVLGLAWLALALAGFYIKKDILWARINFVYSLAYLSLMCIGIMLSTI